MKKILSFLRCISALLLGGLLTLQHNFVTAQSEVQELQKKLTALIKKNANLNQKNQELQKKLQEAQKNEKKLKALCKAQAIKFKFFFPYEDDFIKNLWTNRINYNGKDVIGRRSNKRYIDYIKACLKGLKAAIPQMQSEDEINEAKCIAKDLAELPNLKDFTLNQKYNALQERLKKLKNKAPRTYKELIVYEKIDFLAFPRCWV